MQQHKLMKSTIARTQTTKRVQMKHSDLLNVAPSQTIDRQRANTTPAQAAMNSITISIEVNVLILAIFCEIRYNFFQRSYKLH